LNFLIKSESDPRKSSARLLAEHLALGRTILTAADFVCVAVGVFHHFRNLAVGQADVLKEVVQVPWVQATRLVQCVLLGEVAFFKSADVAASVLSASYTWSHADQVLLWRLLVSECTALAQPSAYIARFFSLFFQRIPALLESSIDASKVAPVHNSSDPDSSNSPYGHETNFFSHGLLTPTPATTESSHAKGNQDSLLGQGGKPGLLLGIALSAVSDGLISLCTLLRTDEGSKIGSRDTGGSERKDLKEEKDPLYSVVRTLTELDVKEVRQGELLRHVLLWHLLQTRSDAVIATLTDLLALSVSPEEEAGSAEANKVATASSETKLVRKKRKRASSSLTKAPPRSEVQLRTIRALSICEFCHFVASARHDSTQMSLNAVRALRSHTSLKQTLVLVPSLLGSDRFSQLRTWFNGMLYAQSVNIYLSLLSISVLCF
jgi:hypothetical protein